MKSLVTGGAGFIGSHIVDKLLSMGHDVIVIDNESAASNEKFYWNDLAKNYKLDIKDYQNTRHLYNGVNYVFHLAAESRIQPSILNPIEAVNNNCVGTCAVLQCSREAGVEKVIYSSTSSGYGLNPAPNIETQQDHCINPYSVSKIAGEKLCSMYHSLFGLKTIILRYFNVYGDRSPASGQYAPVVGIFLKQLANKVPLTIVGDGSKKRDFINVLDVAEANVMSAVHFWKESEYGQVYNVGSGKNFSIKEVADSISINQTFLAPREGEVETTLADISKIANTLGWKPHTDLFEWISKKIS